MTPEIAEIWVYLTASPLLWLSATLTAYVLADALSARLNRHPLANPVVLAAGVLVIVLAVTNTPYTAYFEGAQFVHFMLGPATVALAVPLFRNIRLVRKSLLPMALALVAGSVTAAASAVAIAYALGAPAEVLA